MRLAQQSRSEDEAPARDPDEASRALERISQIFDEQDESGEKGPASDVRGDATPLGETAKKALKEVLADLHPADIAYVLEALPQDDRLAVCSWLTATVKAIFSLKLMTACARPSSRR